MTPAAVSAASLMQRGQALLQREPLHMRASTTLCVTLTPVSTQRWACTPAALGPPTLTIQCMRVRCGRRGAAAAAAPPSGARARASAAARAARATRRGGPAGRLAPGGPRGFSQSLSEQCGAGPEALADARQSPGGPGRVQARTLAGLRGPPQCQQSTCALAAEGDGRMCHWPGGC